MVRSSRYAGQGGGGGGALGAKIFLSDPRFSDPAKLTANMPQLTAILDEIFAAQPMPYWQKVFQGVNVTFGVVRGPQEVINDPQLPLMTLLCHWKVPRQADFHHQQSNTGAWRQKGVGQARPGLGEHNESVLTELGFSASDIGALLSSGALGKMKEQQR